MNPFEEHTVEWTRKNEQTSQAKLAAGCNCNACCVHSTVQYVFVLCRLAFFAVKGIRGLYVLLTVAALLCFALCGDDDDDDSSFANETRRAARRVSALSYLCSSIRQPHNFSLFRLFSQSQNEACVFLLLLYLHFLQ